MTRKALGKGLKTLLPDVELDGRSFTSSMKEINIDSIQPNRYQPRKHFQEKELLELAESIKTNGLLQPIIVRPLSNGKYELIAGERRWRAARIAGLRHIKALIRDESREKLLEIALIENLQREDLNPLEVAKGYDQLIKGFKLSQEEVAKRVGKDRSTVSNYVRLLTLPEKVQEYIAKGLLLPGHGKAILSIEGQTYQIQFAELLIKKKASVREAEALARAWKERRSNKEKLQGDKDPLLKDIERRLQHIFGTRVSIQGQKSKGRIILEYYTMEDLNRILEIAGLGS